MTFPEPQHPADWFTQWWNMVRGKRVDQNRDAWLLGPIGKPGETAETFVARIAAEERLRVERNGTGLLDGWDRFGVGVNPRITAFYTRTKDFEIEARNAWNPMFAGLGFLVAWIFSRRIQQLNLPPSRPDPAWAIESEIICLVDGSGVPRYRVWHRRDRTTGAVIFYGIYTHCRIPSGADCIKAIFPLPHGSATVVFRVNGDDDGNLTLTSAGAADGDPGFYFLVRDRRGGFWKQYLRTFREEIAFSTGVDDILHAHHSMSLWGLPVHDMRYTMVDRRNGAPDLPPPHRPA